MGLAAVSPLCDRRPPPGAQGRGQGADAGLRVRRGRRGRNFHGGKGGGGKTAGEQNPTAAGGGTGRGGGGGGSGRGGRGRAPPLGSNASRGPSPAGGESLFVCVGSRGERTVEVRTGGPWYVKDPRGAKLGPYSAAEIVAWFGSLQVAEGAGAWQDLRTVLPALGGGIPFAKAPKGKEREAEKDKLKEKDKPKEKDKDRDKPNEMAKEKDKDKPKEREKPSAAVPARGGTNGEKGAAGARLEKPAAAVSEKPGKASAGGTGPGLPAEADAQETVGKPSETPTPATEEPAKGSPGAVAAAAAAATATSAPPDAPREKTEKAQAPSIVATDAAGEPTPALPAKAAVAAAPATTAVAGKPAEKPRYSNDKLPAAAPAVTPGSNGVAEPPAAAATKAPTDKELSEWLFRGKSRSEGGGEPLWRYVDNGGKVQGPFSAQQMILWDDSNFFQTSLLMLGCAPNLAPPNLPPTSSYRPFGELLAEARAAWRRQSPPRAAADS